MKCAVQMVNSALVMICTVARLVPLRTSCSPYYQSVVKEVFSAVRSGSMCRYRAVDGVGLQCLMVDLTGFQ